MSTTSSLLSLSTPLSGFTTTTMDGDPVARTSCIDISEKRRSSAMRFMAPSEHEVDGDRENRHASIPAVRRATIEVERGVMDVGEIHLRLERPIGGQVPAHAQRSGVLGGAHV